MKQFSQYGLTLLAGALAVAVACGDDDETTPPANNNNTAMNNNMAANNNMANNNAGPSVTLTFTLLLTPTASTRPRVRSAVVERLRQQRSGRSQRCAPDRRPSGRLRSATRFPPRTRRSTTARSVEFSTTGNDWIWAYDSRHTGSYTIPASASDGDTIVVPGLTIPEWGDWDVRVTLDTNATPDSFDVVPADGALASRPTARPS